MSDRPHNTLSRQQRRALARAESKIAATRIQIATRSAINPAIFRIVIIASKTIAVVG